MANNKLEAAVSAELITDFNSIREEIGLSIEENSLYPALALDSSKDVAPTLVKTANNKYYLIAKQIEEGNFSANGCAFSIIGSRNVNIVYYGSYFTWEASQEISEPAAPNQANALARVLAIDNVTVNRDMPLDKYRGFQEEFNVVINPVEKRDAKIFVYEVDKEKVVSSYNKDRASAEEAAIELINKVSAIKSEDKDLIKENILKNKNSKFALLDTLMNRNSLPSLLASSKINIQELTALPWEQLKDSLLALYNGQQVFILSPEPMETPLLKKTSDYKNLGEALDNLIGDASLGVEEKDLDIGRVLEIGLDKVKNATELFRAWREQSAHSDLPYYVIAAQATRYALENALAFVKKAIEAKRKMSENDAEEKFLELLNEFKLKYNLSLDLRKYFVVLHAGTRTGYPSLPSDFPLSTEMNSLKIDGGTLIFQNDILRGCSDMARTLVLTKEGKELYDLLERSMIENAIPAAKQGNTGSDVYWAGVSLLVEMEGRIKEWGMLPPEASIKDGYNRNIGHIMAKQESVTLILVKEEKSQRLQSGMVGAVEYQWSYKKHALGVEDMFLVTQEKGVNIAR